MPWPEQPLGRHFTSRTRRVRERRGEGGDTLAEALTSGAQVSRCRCARAESPPEPGTLPGTHGTLALKPLCLGWVQDPADCETAGVLRLHRAADLLAGSMCSSVTWRLFVLPFFFFFPLPFLCFSLLVFQFVPTLKSPPEEHQPTERDSLCLDQPEHPRTHTSSCTCTDIRMHTLHL